MKTCNTIIIINLDRKRRIEKILPFMNWLLKSFDIDWEEDFKIAELIYLY
jgi:CMP-N-acetylneuraminic acid synthetase